MPTVILLEPVCRYEATGGKWAWYGVEGGGAFSTAPEQREEGGSMVTPSSVRWYRQVQLSAVEASRRALQQYLKGRVRTVPET